MGHGAWGIAAKVATAAVVGTGAYLYSRKFSGSTSSFDDYSKAAQPVTNFFPTIFSNKAAREMYAKFASKTTPEDYIKPTVDIMSEFGKKFVDSGIYEPLIDSAAMSFGKKKGPTVI